MGAEYISRLVFDFNAVTVTILHEGQVMAGICARVFTVEEFLEIVFCAVDSTLQQRGYGRLVMNYLKMVSQCHGYYDLLTCADNEAVEYFKKQGFNDKAIRMDPKRWVGRIKDYDGVTLVHCIIYPEIDYMNLAAIVQKQINFTEERVGKRMHPSLFKDSERWVPYKQAPLYLNRSLVSIVKETDTRKRRSEESSLLKDYDERMETLRLKLLDVLDKLEQDERFGSVFAMPVTEDIAQGYFDIITKPMDFYTIRRRLTRFRDYYKKPEMFKADIELMVSNCKQFNQSDQIYYKCANMCMNRCRALMEIFDKN